MNIAKKFSFGYVKQHPYMFGAIFIVFGLLLWLWMNRGTSSSTTSGGATAVIPTGGQSDSAVAAQTQLALAQLSAATQLNLAQLSAGLENNRLTAQLEALQLQGENQLALATISTGYQLKELESSERIASQTIASEQAIQTLGISTQAALHSMDVQAALASQANSLATSLAITDKNNQFMLDYAKAADDASYKQAQLQLQGYTTQALLSVIPTLKKSDRDETFQIIAGYVTGNPVTYTNPQGGPAVINPQLLPNGGVSQSGGGVLSTIAKSTVGIAGLFL